MVVLEFLFILFSFYMMYDLLDHVLCVYDQLLHRDPFNVCILRVEFNGNSQTVSGQKLKGFNEMYV